MPRANLIAICLAMIVSIVCYQRGERSLYGRYFSEALDDIHHRALEKVPEEKLFAAAIRGMTDQLDKYSDFISSADANGYREELDQHFVGIGVEVYTDAETGQLKLGNTIIGHPHPAWDAGLRPGDRIVAINGRDAREWKLTDAVKEIRGPADESVTITVEREGISTPIDAVVQRSEIDVDSVLGDFRGPDTKWVFPLKAEPRVAYIRLKTFGDHTAAELRDALTQLKQAGELNALVIDVRDNAGGYLESAVEICDMFVTSGMIVSTRGRDGEIIRQHQATAKGTFTGFPMVVLVNGDSASASEIFAACLQDHGRAKLIGTRSWGKGSVQQMIAMEDGDSILKLTTASFWRPSEKNIHRLKDAEETDEWGVTPEADDLIETDAEAEKLRRETRQRIDQFEPGNATPAEATTLDYDPQLKHAVEYLEQRLSEKG